MLLNFGELGRALKKDGENKVDAAETPMTNFVAGKFYNPEMNQKWVTISNHSFQAYVALVNKRWIASLPDDIKTSLLDMLKECGQLQLKLAVEEDERDKKFLESKGIKFYTWTESEKEKFKKTVVPVHQNYMDKINKELLLEAYETLKTK